MSRSDEAGAGPGASVHDDALWKTLTREIRELESVVVAFSGGVDSTFLLRICLDLLGPDRVLAVTGDSPTLPRRELEEACRLAAELGAAHLVVPTRELEIPAFTKNPPDRCFFCKDELFRRLGALASERKFRSVVDGTNADDLRGHRPGMMAAADNNVRSPLAAAGIGKEAVRRLSRGLGLSTWDKPQMACLASRIPHGEPISEEKLSRVERAEEILKGLGFRNVRVRDHDGLARIEIDAEDIPRFTAAMRDAVAVAFRELGFRFVTLDLEGFRSGSLSS